jgi:7-cyano-7-deazaguanine synthase in queuosine biosynthesis
MNDIHTPATLGLTKEVYSDAKPKKCSCGKCESCRTYRKLKKKLTKQPK